MRRSGVRFLVAAPDRESVLEARCGLRLLFSDTPASNPGRGAFDPAFDFSVAVDFDLSFASASGGFSIGMGIGEDSDGTDSAGLILASLNGALLPFAGAARINDVNAFALCPL